MTVYPREGPSGLNATLTKPRALAQLWMWLGMAGVVVTIAATLARVPCALTRRWSAALLDKVPCHGAGGRRAQLNR